MLKFWRPCVAVALSLIVQAGAASAQTVIARKAPAGSTVELVLNTTKVGTAAADAVGDARLPFTLPAAQLNAGMDAYIHLDVCTDVRRIFVVERNQAPPAPDPGCSRRSITGLFLVRRVSNIVVDTGAINPTVLLRQGPVDLSEHPASDRWSEVPTGLIVSGGAGLGAFRDTLDQLCGSASPCDGEDSHTTYLAGGTLWLGPFIGVEGAFLKPAGVNASGTGTNYSFNSVRSTRLFLINGKAGVPIGKARLYGQGGTNYHRGTTTTTETIDDATVTVNGVIEPIRGGTQVIELKTGGWGWQIGAGLEVWVKPSIGVFVEAQRTRLNGKGQDGGHGELDDYLNSAVLGIRLKIGR